MKYIETMGEAPLGSSVQQFLQRRILSGELKAGEWLPPERDIALELGVSRSSVHQAVLALESRGFVRIVPRKGIQVSDYRKHPTPQSLAAIMSYSGAELDRNIFDDMMEFRIWLETQSARLACTNIYEATAGEMRETARALTRPGAELTALTVRFHYLLTQASGNSIFAMVFRACEPAIYSLTQKRYSLSDGDVADIADQMEKLVELIEQGQREEAAAQVENMLRRGIGYLDGRYC